MTIIQIKSVYSGLSTDTKPSAATGIPAGSIFIESDTQNQFIWTGSAWTQKTTFTVSQIMAYANGVD